MPLGSIDTGTLVRQSKNIMAAQISNSCCCCFLAVFLLFSNASKHITAGKSHWKSWKNLWQLYLMANRYSCSTCSSCSSTWKANTTKTRGEALQWLLCAYMGNYCGACTSCMQHFIGGRSAYSKRTIKQ